jgi:hypothetical protein
MSLNMVYRWKGIDDDVPVRIFAPHGIAPGSILKNCRVNTVLQNHTALIGREDGRLVVAGNFSPIDGCRLVLHRTSATRPGVVVLEVGTAGLFEDYSVPGPDGRPAYLLWDGVDVHPISRACMLGLSVNSRPML